MTNSPRNKVSFRRIRTGQTNYYFRKKLLTNKPIRAVIRKSLKYFLIQFISFDLLGDKILSSTSSQILKKMNWSFSFSNLPAAYVTGYLAGKSALKNNISNAVLDSGPGYKPTKGSYFYSCLKGMIDSGITIPHGEGIFPSNERLFGNHINKKIKQSIDIILKQN